MVAATASITILALYCAYKLGALNKEAELRAEYVQVVESSNIQLERSTKQLESANKVLEDTIAQIKFLRHLRDKEHFEN